MGALYSLLATEATRGHGHRIVPDLYDRAAGEVLFLIISICAIITQYFNPEYIKHNGIKDRYGYNNICVYFDAAPASYIAMPLLVLYAYLMVRYSVTDTHRALLNRPNLTNRQYYFTVATNTVYGLVSICTPMWLLVPPSVDEIFHAGLFQVMMLLKFLVVVANYNECAPSQRSTSVFLFICFFGFIVISFVVILSVNEAYYDERVGGVQPPVVPHQIQQTLDYLFFLYLPLLSLVLPTGPAIRASFRLLPMFEVDGRMLGTAGAKEYSALLAREQIPCPVLRCMYCHGLIETDAEGAVPQLQLRHAMVRLGISSAPFIEFLMEPFQDTEHVVVLRSDISPSCPLRIGSVAGRQGFQLKAFLDFLSFLSQSSGGRLHWEHAAKINAYFENNLNLKTEDVTVFVFLIFALFGKTDGGDIHLDAADVAGLFDGRLPADWQGPALSPSLGNYAFFKARCAVKHTVDAKVIPELQRKEECIA